MTGIRDLLRRFPRDGRLRAIVLRPSRRAEPVAAADALVGADGLGGDHARAGLKAVTLIQFEHLAVVSALAGREATPALLRRNLAVSGLNLAALRGWTVGVGAARLRIVGPCPPCSRMEEALGPGGYNAVRGHGGWYAEVVSPGRVALGDPVAALDPPAEPG